MAENKSILAEAEALINGQRRKDYGDPNRMFTTLSFLWSEYLGHPVHPGDVAAMMAMLKLVRLRNSDYKHRDSLVDAAGYIGLIEQIYRTED